MIKREAQIFLDSRLVRTKLITIRMKSSQVLAAHLNLLVLQDSKLVIWSKLKQTDNMVKSRSNILYELCKLQIHLPSFAKTMTFVTNPKTYIFYEKSD